MPDTSIEQLNKIVERLRETVMEDLETQDFVNARALNDMKHFQNTFPDQELGEAVHSEMLCQYQVSVWYQIFHMLGDL